MVNTVQDTFKHLLSTEKFGEIILVAWAYVEYMIDQFMLKQLNVGMEDATAREFISKITFNVKWEYLKGCDIFTDVEKEKITFFQKKRNKLFHNALFNDQDYYSTSGRKTLITTASNAFYTVYEVFERRYIKHG